MTFLQLSRTCFLLACLALNACKSDRPALFTRLSESRTNIGFVNTLRENETANVLNYTYFYNGGGVAVGDINNDGLADIFFSGNMVANRLYLNKGDLEFEDITGQSGVAKLQGWCTGATMVDINSDGYTDIYVCRSADIDPERRKNLLFLNNGNGSFTESAAQYGLADNGYSTQASFFDYDKDGDLDMFLANHSLQQYAFGGYENAALRSQQNAAFASKLFRNDSGRFSDVSKEAGIVSNVLSFGLNVMISDYNNDSWPDIYVDNDFNEPDYLFINQQNGVFKEDAAGCLDAVSLYSMGSDAADYNNDGLIDLVSLDMQPEDNRMQKMHSGAENFDKFQLLFRSGFYYQYSRNMLHRNNGNGTFSEIGQLAGISNTDWSWAALFCDFDNDGNKDLFVTNGYEKDYTDMDMIRYRADIMVKQRRGEAVQPLQQILDGMPSVRLPNYMYRNDGSASFSNKTEEWGLTERSVSSGAAYADLDNDGDMDLIINNINAAAGIYRNNAEAMLPGNRYMKIKLQGSPQNPAGFGAKLTLYCGGFRYYQEQIPVRGFQSSVDAVLNFGVGKHQVADSVEVIWPDNRRQLVRSVRSAQTLTLRWDDAHPFTTHQAASGRPFFQVGDTLAFIHTENEFSDFTRQPLMPNFLSRQGPALARADINGDGREDLFIGGAKGQPAGLFLQSADGGFIRQRAPAITSDSASEDVAAVFFDADKDRDMDLYVASGGYECREKDTLLQDRLYLNNGRGNFTKAIHALPSMRTVKGSVAAADIDADGDTDLFVGGRVIPGKYPLPPQSAVLINDGNGSFQDATMEIAPGLQKIGMVTGAVWADVNTDRQPDLVIVGEWMPIRIFLNEKGKLHDASESFVNFPSAGWWNTVTAADLDLDGDIDLLAGNTGMNTQFKGSSEEPVTLYYKDFDGNASIDPVLCYYIQGVSYPAASRDDLVEQLPALKKKFLTYRSYADATISDVFTGAELRDAGVLKAGFMESVILENNGSSGFSLKRLPAEAQFSPVYAISVFDVNADGKQDIILAGNNSFTRIKFGNYRANQGCVLTGDGRNGFTYLSQPQSGLHTRKNVRNMTVLETARGAMLVMAVNDGRPECYYLDRGTGE